MRKRAESIHHIIGTTNSTFHSKSDKTSRFPRVQYKKYKLNKKFVNIFSAVIEIQQLQKRREKLGNRAT